MVVLTCLSLVSSDVSGGVSGDIIGDVSSFNTPVGQFNVFFINGYLSLALLNCFLHLYVYLCMYVCVCAYACMCMCIGMCRSHSPSTHVGSRIELGSWLGAKHPYLLIHLDSQVAGF